MNATAEMHSSFTLEVLLLRGRTATHYCEYLFKLPCSIINSVFVGFSFCNTNCEPKQRAWGSHMSPLYILFFLVACTEFYSVQQVMLIVYVVEILIQSMYTLKCYHYINNAHKLA